MFRSVGFVRCGAVAVAGPGLGSAVVRRLCTAQVQPEHPALLYNEFIRLHQQHNQFNKAREVLLDMVADNVEPNRATFLMLVECAASALQGAASARQIRLLVEDAKRARLADEAVFNTALVGLLRQHRTKDIVLMFRDMVLYGAKPAELTYRVLLSAYSRVGMFEEVRQALEEMKERGMQPGRGHYLRAMVAARNCGDKEACFRQFEELRQLGGTLDSGPFCLLLDCVGDLASKLEILAYMQELQVAPCEVVLGKILRAALANRDWDVALDMLVRAQGLQAAPRVTEVVFLSPDLDVGFAKRALGALLDAREEGRVLHFRNSVTPFLALALEKGDAEYMDLVWRAVRRDDVVPSREVLGKFLRVLRERDPVPENLVAEVKGLLHK